MAQGERHHVVVAPWLLARRHTQWCLGSGSRDLWRLRRPSRHLRTTSDAHQPSHSSQLKMTTIKVLYFASIREQVGHREEQLVLENAVDGAGDVVAAQALTLAHVRRQLCEKYPDARETIGQIALAKNLEYADDDTPVHDGDEVALIPPISGG